MRNTKPYLSTDEIKNVVPGYDNNKKLQPFLNLQGFYFGPTANSTINDMLTFLQANISEKDAAIKLTHQITYAKKYGFGLGLGWMSDVTEDGDRNIYHDGNTKIGYHTLCIFTQTRNQDLLLLLTIQ